MVCDISRLIHMESVELSSGLVGDFVELVLFYDIVDVSMETPH